MDYKWFSPVSEDYSFIHFLLEIGEKSWYDVLKKEVIDYGSENYY